MERSSSKFPDATRERENERKRHTSDMLATARATTKRVISRCVSFRSTRLDATRRARSNGTDDGFGWLVVQMRGKDDDRDERARWRGNARRARWMRRKLCRARCRGDVAVGNDETRDRARRWVDGAFLN